MKVIVYHRLLGEELVKVAISYSETNLDIARQEAYDGTYKVEEVAADVQ